MCEFYTEQSAANTLNNHKNSVELTANSSLLAGTNKPAGISLHGGLLLHKRAERRLRDTLKSKTSSTHMPSSKLATLPPWLIFRKESVERKKKGVKTHLQLTEQPLCLSGATQRCSTAPERVKQPLLWVKIVSAAKQKVHSLLLRTLKSGGSRWTTFRVPCFGSSCCSLSLLIRPWHEFRIMAVFENEKYLVTSTSTAPNLLLSAAARCKNKPKPKTIGTVCS